MDDVFTVREGRVVFFPDGHIVVDGKTYVPEAKEPVEQVPDGQEAKAEEVLEIPRYGPTQPCGPKFNHEIVKFVTAWVHELATDIGLDEHREGWILSKALSILYPDQFSPR
jgi:hypothetical protein